LNGAASSLGFPQPDAFLFNSIDTSTDDGLLGGVLFGTITYNFTPAVPTIPEPSTWAMMLMGFAGLGYAALRRKAAVRTISA
jgi:hypothetical protein